MGRPTVPLPNRGHAESIVDGRTTTSASVRNTRVSVRSSVPIRFVAPPTWVRRSSAASATGPRGKLAPSTVAALRSSADRPASVTSTVRSGSVIRPDARQFLTDADQVVYALAKRSSVVSRPRQLAVPVARSKRKRPARGLRSGRFPSW
jgi:hypothetical protein